MDRFAKKVDNYKNLTISAKTSIIDISLGSENANVIWNQLKVRNSNWKIVKYCDECAPFQVNVSFLYSMGTLENLLFSDIFRTYGNGTLTWNGLIYDTSKTTSVALAPHFENPKRAASELGLLTNIIFPYWCFIFLLMTSIYFYMIKTVNILAGISSLGRILYIRQKLRCPNF